MNGVKQDRLVKQLHSQLSELESEIESSKLEISNMQKELSLKVRNKESIEQKINDLKIDNKDIKLSEHALVRYFERVKGYNIEEIENEIITDELKKLVETLGLNGTYPFGEYKLKVRNGIIVTLL